MRLVNATLLTLVMMGPTAMAAESVLAVSDSPQVETIGVPVDRVRVTRVSGFKPINRKQVVLFGSPSKSYLVTLRSRAFDLRSSQAIGFTSTGASIHAKFDALIINGFRYPIESITLLEKGTARDLRWGSPTLPTL